MCKKFLRRNNVPAAAGNKNDSFVFAAFLQEHSKRKKLKVKPQEVGNLTTRKTLSVYM